MRLLLTLILLYCHRHHVALGWRRGRTTVFLKRMEARGWRIDRLVADPPLEEAWIAFPPPGARLPRRVDTGIDL